MGLSIPQSCKKIKKRKIETQKKFSKKDDRFYKFLHILIEVFMPPQAKMMGSMEGII